MWEFFENTKNDLEIGMPIFFFFKFWLAAIVIVVCLLHELEMCLAAANSDLDN